MSPDERVVQQVAGILTMHGIEFTTDDDHESFLVPWGSAGVVVTFADWKDGTMIRLIAYVLEDVDVADERRALILEELNARNRRIPLGALHLDPDRRVIVLDYSLLGDELQAGELTEAVGMMGTLADELDDDLRGAIGTGVRATDAWSTARGGASGDGPVGPIVSA